METIQKTQLITNIYVENFQIFEIKEHTTK